MDGFADRVRARAKELTMSQIELASAAGLSPQRLNNYLKTSREPDMATLVRIAIALKTTTDWLLGASARIEAPLSAVVHRLLELDGMSPERANALATASVEALRIYAALPNEGDELMRSRMAAQAVWQIRGAPRPN